MRRSPETQMLVDFLRKIDRGQVISLSAVSAAVGFDVREYRSKLYNARDIINREQDGKIDLKGDWLRRLEDVECVTTKKEHFRKKARNAAKRGSSMLYSVDYQALPEALQKEHNTSLAMFGAVQASVGAYVVRKLKEKEGPRFLPSDAIGSLEGK